MSDSKKKDSPPEVNTKPIVNPKNPLPTNTSMPTFLQRGIEGRDGKGPCTVINGTLMMPNGDVAPVGSTFDPVVEKMHKALYQCYVGRKRITPADKKVEDKLYKKETVKKGG